MKWGLSGIVDIAVADGAVRALIIWDQFSGNYYGLGIFGDSKVFTPCLYEDENWIRLKKALDKEYRLAYPKKGKP